MQLTMSSTVSPEAGNRDFVPLHFTLYFLQGGTRTHKQERQLVRPDFIFHRFAWSIMAWACTSASSLFLYMQFRNEAAQGHYLAREAVGHKVPWELPRAPLQHTFCRGL